MSNDARPTILIVDDTAENLHVLSGLLQPDYRVLAATSGERCLELAARSEPAPDLILLDIMMPGLDGYQTLGRLRADAATHEIPVIFITAMEGSEAQLHGLAAGAVDYIAKPIDPPIVLARVRTQIELKRARDRLRDQNVWLEAEVARRMAENETTQTVAIRALAHLAEIRDPETGNHIHRTQNYVRALALRVRDHPRFKDLLSDRNIELLVRSAPLHDIGKVGIPDQILLKPGPLDPAEWEIMKTHARLGFDAIELAEEDAEQPVAFLTLAKEIAHWHHEKWDGSGYPDGLTGETIPWAARLMALADVFDALITRRPYKAPMSFEQARDIIRAGRGSHFDPDLTDAFLDIYETCVAIALLYRDASGS
jgi:putative two-component system response regulator